MSPRIPAPRSFQSDVVLPPRLPHAAVREPGPRIANWIAIAAVAGTAAVWGLLIWAAWP